MRSRRPILTTLICSAIAYMRFGRLADARAEVGKMMKLDPGITVNKWRLGYPFRDPAILDRYSLALIQSGLPGT